MDSESKDAGGVTENKEITRRRFLKRAALVGGRVLVGIGAAGSAASYFVDDTASKQKPKPQPATPTATGTPTPEKPKFEDPVEARVKQMTLLERDIYGSVVKNPIFANCTPLEKLVALDYVKPQVLQYKGATGDAHEKSIKRVLNLENIDLYYQNAINEIIKYKENLNPILKDTAFKDLILSLIFVESKGIASQVGDSGDTGLCQLLPSTIQGIAKRRGKVVSLADMVDPSLNVRYAIAHLNESLNNFKDLGVALWVYNMGHGNMVNLIEAYFKGDRPDYSGRVLKVINGEKVDEFENPDPITKLDNRPPLTKIVDHLGLDLVTLLNSDSVKKWLEKAKNREKNPVGKTTEFYVTRIAAANYLLDTFKSDSNSASAKKAA